MIVVDASALANALTDRGELGERARAELSRDEHWASPEHLIAETFSFLRGRRLGGKLTERRASDALSALMLLEVELVSTKVLLPRMWQLRDNISGYDAAYVAAAEMQACPLVTADARLERATGVRCEVWMA